MFTRALELDTHASFFPSTQEAVVNVNFVVVAFVAAAGILVAFLGSYYMF